MNKDLNKIREHRAINNSTYAEACAAVENGWTPGELTIIEKLKICRCSMLRATGFCTEIGFIDNVMEFIEDQRWQAKRAKDKRLAKDRNEA